MSYLLFDSCNTEISGQHGFRLRYSCDSQVITVFQDIAEPLEEGFFIDAIIADFSKAFNLVPHNRLLKKLANSGDGFEGSRLGRRITLGRTQRVRVGGQLPKEVKVTSGVTQENFGPTTVSSRRKRYLVEH